MTPMTPTTTPPPVVPVAPPAPGPVPTELGRLADFLTVVTGDAGPDGLSLEGVEAALAHQLIDQLGVHPAHWDTAFHLVAAAQQHRRSIGTGSHDEPSDQRAYLHRLLTRIGPVTAPVPIEGRPVTGVDNDRWHAVDQVRPAVSGGRVPGVSVCGRGVDVARKFGAFDRDHWGRRACPECAWLLAIRDHTLDAEYARLEDHSAGALGQLASHVARAVVAAARAAQDDTGSDLDDPRTVQLLVAVTAHAPTTIYDHACLEDECDHHEDHPDEHGGHAHLPTAVACAACSLLEGSWAGEYEGAFRTECTVAAPCSVLTALAASHAVSLPRPPPSPTSSPCPADR